VVPLGQPQVPPAQVWPALHSTPHRPHEVGSVAVSTQAEPQAVCPGAEQAQAPFTHRWLAPQAWPQAPQFA
jgi:hypothetical protein